MSLPDEAYQSALRAATARERARQTNREWLYLFMLAAIEDAVRVWQHGPRLGTLFDEAEAWLAGEDVGLVTLEGAAWMTGFDDQAIGDRVRRVRQERTAREATEAAARAARASVQTPRAVVVRRMRAAGRRCAGR